MRASQSGKVEKEIAFSIRFLDCSLVSTARPPRSIGQQHVDLPESRRRTAMADSIDLPRLPLAVIGRAPLRPIARAGDAVAGLPQIRGARLIGHARNHPLLFASLDRPKRIAAELEVVALMVDGPTAVAIDENTVVDARNEVLQRSVGLARFEPHVGHALEWDAGPVVGVAAAA